MKKQCQDKDSVKYIYRRYIVKNGVKIYPKNAKAFRIKINN
jgi:hypothetical protein